MPIRKMKPEVKKEYIELLQEALSVAMSYQDWTEYTGRSRFVASEEYRKLRSFESIYKNEIKKEGMNTFFDI